MNRQAGFSWIELLVVLAILSVIASIAIPRLHEAEMAGNESAAAASVRTIVTAQTAYHVTAGQGQYSSGLQALSNAALIDSVLGSGSKEGYQFNCTGAGGTFTVTASPVRPGETGRKYYYADQSGVIRFNVGGPADGSSPNLGQSVSVGAFGGSQADYGPGGGQGKGQNSNSP